MNNKSESKNCVVQCRVSAIKQTEGESLERQEKSIRSFVDGKGWKIVPDGKVWSTAISGRKTDREDFEEILFYIKSHPGLVDYYVFRSIDRATRAGNAEYERMKMELGKYGVSLLDAYGVIQPMKNTLDDVGFQYEWSKFYPSEISEGVLVTVAKQEVTTILTRMIGQEIRLTQQGYRTRRPADGYANKKIFVDGKKKTIQIPDEKRAKFFVAMFTLRAEGNSDKDIVKKVNAMGYTSPIQNRYSKDKKKIIGQTGGKPLTLKALQKYITNTIYAGVLCEKWTDYKLVKAQYDGLVSIDIFNRANKGKLSIFQNNDGTLKLVRNDPSNNRTKSRMRHNPLFPYKIVLCPFCGKPFKGSSPSGRSGQGFPTYHCGRKHKFYGVKKKVFEETIENFIHSLRFKPEIKNTIEMTLLNKYREREMEIVHASSSIHQNIADLQIEQENKLRAIVESKSSLVREKFEKDVENLEEKIKIARQERLQIEISEGDVKHFINEVKKIVEHPAEILIDTENLESHNNLFRLIFEKMPTYSEFVSGTPKMAWIFDIFNKKTLNESLVTLRGVGPRLQP